MHNVQYLLNLMGKARTAIIEDRYPDFLQSYFWRLYPDRSKIPLWAVDALRSVGVELIKA